METSEQHLFLLFASTLLHIHNFVPTAVNKRNFQDLELTQRVFVLGEPEMKEHGAPLMRFVRCPSLHTSVRMVA